MAKEGLFNVVENYLDWSEVRALDLYAGTGNISFEMASRGCEDITSVDSFRDCLRFIDKTATQLNYGAIKTSLGDAERFLKKTMHRWDFIFADPPYDYPDYSNLIALALERLPEDGLFVLEHSVDHDFQQHPACFDQRRYGSVHMSFFSLEAQGSTSDIAE
jgi:16S rRNA G966 N2-methylase RsmD